MMLDKTDDCLSKGLDHYEFRLLLDDIQDCSQNQSAEQDEYNRFAGSDRRSTPIRGHCVSERKASQNFELSPGPVGQSTIRRVVNLLNEGGITFSEKKPKKSSNGKNLTPETNYTQKESACIGSSKPNRKTSMAMRQDDNQPKSAQKDFQLWGSYHWSKDEHESQSRKTLTAYSEAFEPESAVSQLDNPVNLNGELGRYAPQQPFTPSVFDLDGLRAMRIPKKHSLVLTAAAEWNDFFGPFRPSPRRLSFQEKPNQSSAGLNQPESIDELKRVPMGSGTHTRQTTRFAHLVKAPLEPLLADLQIKVERLLAASPL